MAALEEVVVFLMDLTVELVLPIKAILVEQPPLVMDLMAAEEVQVELELMAQVQLVVEVEDLH
jgi:hypothetical protein